jgi:hypothetical protein
MYISGIQYLNFGFNLSGLQSLYARYRQLYSAAWRLFFFFLERKVGGPGT